MKKIIQTKWGDKEARRKDIMHAAQLLLEIKGYSLLSIRDVAKQAQISPGLLYSYFQNKDELFAALYADRLDEFKKDAIEICINNDSTEQLLVALLDAYLPLYRTFGKEFNVFSMMKNTENFSKEIEQRLIENAMQLMLSLSQRFMQLEESEQSSVFSKFDQKSILVMFWIALNGLAEHFSGDRQNLYNQNMQCTALFFFKTLVIGLRQQASLNN